MKKQPDFNCYEEAIRYIYNAEDLLKKATPESRYYADLKYLKSATGTAYAGIEKGVKWYAKLNGIKLRGGKVQMIKDGLRKINKTVLSDFVSLYSEIHIGICYEDNAKIKSVKDAFEDAIQFIVYLKPLTNFRNTNCCSINGICKIDCYSCLNSIRLKRSQTG